MKPSDPFPFFAAAWLIGIAAIAILLAPADPSTQDAPPQVTPAQQARHTEASLPEPAAASAPSASDEVTDLSLG